MAKKKDIPTEKAKKPHPLTGKQNALGNKGNANPPVKFPEGNQFWQLRSKHGRDRIIKDPQALATAAAEYFQSCIDNPIYVVDFKGKDVEQVEYPKPRVFQKVGVCRYCGVRNWTEIESLRALSSDFSKVIDQIESVIYEQKFEHAAIGVFNPVLIARDLKIADVTESTVKVSVSDLSDAELEQKVAQLTTIVNAKNK